MAADKHEKLLEECPEYKKFWDASVSASTWKIKGGEGMLKILHRIVCMTGKYSSRIRSFVS